MDNNKSTPMVLEFDDGTGEAIDQAEKQKEEIAKETEKELEDRVKVADEVNNAKETILNIKGLQEKLILSEEDDRALNESADELEEALPKDLALAYKNRPFKIGYGNQNLGYGNIKTTSQGTHSLDSEISKYDNHRVDYDFQNSEYEKITPEEAIKLKRNGEADKLRVVFDGKLVAFTPDGKPIYKASRDWDSNKELYNKKGNYVAHTTLLPFKDIMERASAIYKADEKPANAELQAKRAENPESRFTTKQDVFNNINRYTISSYESAKRDLAHQKRNLAKAQQDLEQAIENGADADRIERLQDEVSYWASHVERAKKNYARYSADLKKFRAARRGYSSQETLQKVFKEFKELRNQYDDVSRTVRNSQQQLDHVKAQGSPDVQRRKEELNQAKEQLKNINLRIAKLEMYLESADEDNAAEIEKAAQQLDKYTGELNTIQKNINSLLRKEEVEPEEGMPLEEAKIITGFESYEPWSGAVSTYDKIEDAGKLEALDALIDELYPEGIDEVQLNDILWFESDWVLGELGIEEDEDE